MRLVPRKPGYLLLPKASARSPEPTTARVHSRADPAPRPPGMARARTGAGFRLPGCAPTLWFRAERIPRVAASATQVRPALAPLRTKCTPDSSRAVDRDSLEVAMRAVPAVGSGVAEVRPEGSKNHQEEASLRRSAATLLPSGLTSI